MTPTQMARRSDALYADGTCGMTRRVLCDMVAQREADIEDARAECAKLREQLAKARDPQRIGGTADPESFVYAIEQLREFRWQHATNDEEAIPYINNVADAHERENAKLRDERDGWKKLCVDQEVMHFRREETLDNENTKLRELGVEVDK